MGKRRLRRGVEIVLVISSMLQMMGEPSRVVYREEVWRSRKGEKWVIFGGGDVLGN